MNIRSQGVTLEGGRFLVAFDYDPRLVKSMRRIPGAMYLGGDEKHWAIPNRPASAEALHDFAAYYAVPASPAAQGALDRAKVGAARVEIQSSAVDDETFVIDGVVSSMTPMGYQRAGVSYAVRQRRTFIADQPGLGKTGQAIMAIQAADAYPALIVVPAVLKVNWAREVGKWLGPNRSTVVLGTQSPYVIGNPDFVVINYDILHYWACQEGPASLDAIKVEGRHWVPGPLVRHGFKSLVFDESHYLRNENLRYAGARHLSNAIGDDGMILMLTGTPVVVGPVDLIAQLEIMRRLRDFGGRSFFLRRYCDAKKVSGRLVTSGSSNRDELHRRLMSTCYVRRQKSVVLAGQLPPKYRHPIPLHTDPVIMKEYAAAETDVVTYLTKRSAMLASQMGQDPTGAAVQTRLRAESAVHLVRLSALKRLAAMAKMAAVEQWLEEWLERPAVNEATPRKIILFAHHRSVLEALLKRTERFGAVMVIGGMSEHGRQAAIDRFQDEPGIRVIVCALTSASIGITLHAASDVAFVEMGWTPSLHEQAEDRAHRIGQQDEVNAWYLLGEGTLDRSVYDDVEAQRIILDEISDGLEPEVEDEEGGGAVGKRALQRVLERYPKEKAA